VILAGGGLGANSAPVTGYEPAETICTRVGRHGAVLVGYGNVRRPFAAANTAILGAHSDHLPSPCCAVNNVVVFGSYVVKSASRAGFRPPRESIA